MAARLNPEARDEIVDLRLVAAAELDPVLEEEAAAWRDELDGISPNRLNWRAASSACTP